MYIPSTKHDFPGDVQWGDGSQKQIKYAGEAPAIGTMINTGGAADAHLISVGCTLDHFTKLTGRDFIYAFDKKHTYLMRDAKFSLAGKGYTLQHSDDPNAVMKAATRPDGEGGVYEIPLYDRQNMINHENKTSRLRALAARVKHISLSLIHI